MGKFGDLAAPNGALIVHQAGLPITVFGHRMSTVSQSSADEEAVVELVA